MSKFIEFYEVKTRYGYEYYFMPVDNDTKNKQNLDGESHRIWKMNKKSFKFETIKDIRKDPPAVTAEELFSILFTGKPVPYSDYYLSMQRALELIDAINEEKSST